MFIMTLCGVPLVSMVCPQRSAPSVCAPSARRALGSARPQLSTPLASAPSVQEPRSVLVCRRPVVFIMIMCSSCAVGPWWALGGPLAYVPSAKCALGQARPQLGAPSPQHAPSVQESISLCPTGAGPCCTGCLSCAVWPWCALSAVRPRCMCPRPGVPSARRALGSARPRASAPSAQHAPG